MKKFYFLLVTIFVVTLSFGQTEVFINEIHYDNKGGDVDEGIEIAGPAGTDLAGWSIELYNGSSSMIYGTTMSLTGVIPNQQNNRGTLWFPQPGIQNGNPDGLALINPLGIVVQFLSYGGIITAADGAAKGMVSTDIGVFETDPDTLIGHSLQLSGSGVYYDDFTWNSPTTATADAINSGQTFNTAPAIISNTYRVAGLDYEVGSPTATEGSFVVSGTNLTDDIIITAPTDFEISTTSGVGFGASITLPKGLGTITPTTIYVRLKLGLIIGSYSQNITCLSSGATDKISLLAGIVSPITGSIIITEIMSDPSAVDDDEGEYFEVYNTTASAIDMEGWVISDVDSDSHIIASSVIVPANGYAVFARNSNSGANGGFTANYEYSGFILTNDIDEIILTSGVTEIDRVVYSDVLGYPLVAGKSMELSLENYNSADNLIALNWGEATTTYGGGDYGTPGTENNFTLSVVKNQIENFAMYPNPVSNGKLYMASNNKLTRNVTIYTLTGQQVYSKNLQTKEYLNISNLNKGIYIVKIEEGGKIATRKLVVN
ncbi:lamin tail domain-containing protein [Lutibacter sp. A64]|uniref:lamin tail domain-containing protein n=1 Tax=Lutibacter sp. A64 TaxID=2918526 RepID=UPI001F0663A9|nr:lamin tail domain-containing protein [Lutibacter sp. A64]UMB52853.1 lamin tail domain-containing protein [Lutibacter sp. A64]